MLSRQNRFNGVRYPPKGSGILTGRYARKTNGPLKALAIRGSHRPTSLTGSSVFKTLDDILHRFWAANRGKIENEHSVKTQASSDSAHNRGTRGISGTLPTPRAQHPGHLHQSNQPDQPNEPDKPDEPHQSRQQRQGVRRRHRVKR